MARVTGDVFRVRPISENSQAAVLPAERRGRSSCVGKSARAHHTPLEKERTLVTLVTFGRRRRKKKKRIHRVGCASMERILTSALSFSLSSSVSPFPYLPLYHYPPAPIRDSGNVRGSCLFPTRVVSLSPSPPRFNEENSDFNEILLIWRSINYRSSEPSFKFRWIGRM